MGQGGLPLQILIANDADIHLETANGERPYDIAVRYNQYHCYTMLECAGEKVFILGSMGRCRAGQCQWAGERKRNA